MSAISGELALLALATLLQAAPDQSPLVSDSAVAPVTAAAGVAPDTVAVGDPFRAKLRIHAPAGSTVEFPVFNLLDPVESVDSMRVTRDSAGHWTATYRLVAWSTGDSLVAAIPFRLRDANGAFTDRRIRVALPHVRSVLPADSSLHVPRPAKAVIPIVTRGPAPRGWVLPAVLLSLVLAVIAWLVFARRRAASPGTADPRATALLQLDAIERERLPERGAVLEYHTRVSRVLREYLAAQAAWGEHLTTTELLAAARRAGAGEPSALALERLLHHADRIKFSGAAAARDRAAAERFGATVRDWIVGWPPAAEPLPRREAA